MALSSRDGTIRGQAGWAWRFGSIEVYRPEQARTLAAWLLHTPGSPGLWQHHVLSVGRTDAPLLPASEAARLTGQDAATHFIIVVPVDSAHHPTVSDQTTIVPLLPANVDLLFACGSDELAITLASLLVDAVVDGWISPETPAPGVQDTWEQALAKALEHGQRILERQITETRPERRDPA